MAHRKQPTGIQNLPEDESGSLTVAVMSDLHAYDNDEPDNAPSHYCIRDPFDDPGKSPIAGLTRLIESEHLSAEVLLCPGDIADKANPLAIQHAWKAIHQIGQSLRTGQIVATSGNHDVDSRFKHNDFDARGVLQALEPPYPFPDENLNDRYWSRHFVLTSGHCYRVPTVNSSAFHGEGQYSETKLYEFERGRVSQRTLAAIRRELERSAPALVNILLCHHHPHPHSELRLAESDLMAGGRELLELLGSGRYGDWIVVHGHKHHPKLENAAGGASAPVVFAAGSLCATLYRELQTRARNQFYMLAFPYSEYRLHGFVGRFRAWDWAVGNGWLPATEGSGLPAHGGFGWRGKPSVLARQIASAAADSPTPWSVIRAMVPSVDFLLPQDLDDVRIVLGRDHRLKVIPEVGTPIEIARLA